MEVRSVQRSSGIIQWGDRVNKHDRVEVGTTVSITAIARLYYDFLIRLVKSVNYILK